MSRKTTRRSISISGLTYCRLSDFAKGAKRSRSRILEEFINERLDAEGAPKVSPDDPRIKALKSELPNDDFESGVKLL